jgi:hypothetical protein
MSKKGDDDNDEVDDVVRTTTLSQNRATATLSTEESFLRTQFFILLPSYQQRGVGRGTGYKWSMRYLQMIPAGFSLPRQTFTQLKQGLQSLQ